MYQFLYEFIDMLPSLPSLPQIEVIKNFLLEMIDTVSYFLPMNHLLLIYGLYIGIINFNFFYKVITKVWESIPTN